jgi:adenosylmethionine-8-amino-7-oxononanoate aminotransferase
LSLLELDRRHVWHPYGPMPATQPALPVVSAAGVRLKLADGRELIDGMASWWCAIHGYRNPALDAAVRDQLDRMAHVMFGGLTHEPAVKLAKRLVDMTGLEHVFFADSGSVSVEVAMKMCRQARPGRTKFLTVRGGYHGDTLSCMSVCDPVGGMHELFAGSLEQHAFADRPPEELDDAYADHLESLVTDELCAVIVEPVVQGAGGMWFYDPAVLGVLRELCDRHGLLLVFDEIATGFGRTGALFAKDHAGVQPDVMCVGKALTGGYMTLAATLCTPGVASSLSGGALMHGPTYMANPLACAVGNASLDELDWERDVPRIEAGLRTGLDGVAGARVKGAIGVIELDHPVDVAAAGAAAVELGVWLRPFRNLVYVMPPYVIGDDDLARVCEAMRAAAEAAG